MADPMTIMALASTVGATASVGSGIQARNQAKKGDRKANQAIQEEKAAAQQEKNKGEMEAQVAAQRQRRIAGSGGRQSSFLTGFGGTQTNQGQQRTLLGG